MNEECGTCRFWQWDGTIGDDQVGACRRYPPKTNLVALTHYRLGNEIPEDFDPFAATNPCTLESDWCGEYQQKEELT